MINKWVKEEDRIVNIPNLFVSDLTEKNNFDSKKLKEFLAQMMFVHLEHVDIFKKRFDKENQEKIENYLVKFLLPHPNAPYNPRQGFWAEIVSAEILKSLNNHILPIHKLRYKELRDAAMRGKADVVTCKINNNIPEINFSEVKSKSVYISPKESEKLAKEAFKGVFKNNNDYPEILKSIADNHMLENPEDYSLMQILDDALKSPDSYSKNFHIFFLFDKEKWKEECLDFFDKNKLKNKPNLNVHIFLINSLKDLIVDTYDLIPEYAGEIVNHE